LCTGIAANLRDHQANSLELQTSLSEGTSANFYANDRHNSRHKELAVHAVVLDEFLKELSAISQEMSIVLLNENFKTK
jgi:hypothetical protein